jgi:hypothetical protein
MADAYHGLDLISHLTDQVAEEEEASRREITLRERIAAVSGSDWRDTLGLADAWAQHALAREQMTTTRDPSPTCAPHRRCSRRRIGATAATSS